MTKLLFFACVLGALASHATAGPLHNAVKDGDIEQVKLLIAQGEDVNQRSRSLGSPLHQAAIWGTAEMAALLIAEGADVNVRHRVLSTPLSIGARKGNEAVVAVLIANGAEIDARSADGTTPLHGAAEGGHAAIVELLVASGANVNARSTRTSVAVDYAPVHSAGLNGHFDIVDLLQAMGATGPTIKPVLDRLASADPGAGEKFFINKCAECHLIEKGNFDDRPGPNLWGVLGRRKASVEQFSYSAAIGRLV
ncbi:MAG: ankyrin repeat domain-containing protein, partial [Alphaproteobacteria bacterium]